MEIISAVIECGAALALPTTLMHTSPIPSSPVLFSAPSPSPSPSPSPANATEAAVPPAPKESMSMSSGANYNPPVPIPTYNPQSSIGSLYPGEQVEY